LLEPIAPPAPHGSAPPGSPPDTPFSTVLDDHQARTADAEGHRRAEREPAPDAPADGTALAALLGGMPLAADVPLVVVPGPAEPEPAGGRVLSPGEASREQARGIVLTRATRPIGVPADATALPLRPPVPGAETAQAEPATASSSSLPVGLGAAGVEGRGEIAGAAGAARPALASATRLADVLQAAVRADAAAAAEPAAIPSPATAAGRAQAAEGQASATAATPATPATPTSAPAAPAAPATPPAPAHASAPAEAAAPTRAVGLEHAVETVRLALRAGAERGVSHARISLTPRELGTIEVHLRHTPEGLVARVVAEHASAVQQLQQAGAELRRALEQQGVTLLRLDVGAFGGESAGRRGTAFDTAFGEDRGRRRDADPLAPLDGAGEVGAADETTTTLQLPNGALVDVLA
jgi:hypothetical protein